LSKRIVAIGDIHGCSIALNTLLNAIDPQPDDTIVSLGDLVDRGDNSKGVIDSLMALRSKCNFVLVQGNHEDMLLAVVKKVESPQEWLKHGGVSTLDSYGFTGDLGVIPEDHIKFIETGVLYHETDDHFFVHGNYEPQKSLDDQDEEILKWRSLIENTPGPHMSGKKAIVGHTPDKSGEVFDIGHLMCLDTYCYGGMWLTAADVVNGTVWQANEEGELRTR
jgi:serine/threonine protein phosphatase 1